MIGNKKPKGDKPKAPPPPPMKPQNIEAGDYKLTVEEVARAFGVPPHLLEQSEEGSVRRNAAKEIGLAFIKHWALALEKYCDELDSASAEIEKQNNVAGSNLAGGD